MAIDKEPKNGDFARYIETLNRAGPKPGVQTYQTHTAPPASTNPDNLSDAPWGKAAPPPMSSSSPGDTRAPKSESADAGTATLAALSAKRKIGAVLTVAGALTGWGTVRTIFNVINSNPFRPEDLAPAAFLGFCTIMLFRAAKRMRAQQRIGPAALPPLKTGTYRKDGEG